MVLSKNSRGEAEAFFRQNHALKSLEHPQNLHRVSKFDSDNFERFKFILKFHTPWRRNLVNSTFGEQVGVFIVIALKAVSQNDSYWRIYSTRQSQKHVPSIRFVTYKSTFMCCYKDNGVVVVVCLHDILSSSFYTHPHQPWTTLVFISHPLCSIDSCLWMNPFVWLLSFCKGIGLEFVMKPPDTLALAFSCLGVL